MSYVYYGNTYIGCNGTFIAVRYKRTGEWFGGVRNTTSSKPLYGPALRSSYAAAEYAENKASLAAGEDSKLMFNDRNAV